MHRPHIRRFAPQYSLRSLGRAWLVVYAPFSLAVARLHCIARLAARSFARLGWRACRLGRQHFLCRGTIRLFVSAAFWAAAKCGRHSIVLNLAKILLNYSFFISAAAACPPSAEKIYKRCFCSVSSAPAAGRIS